MAFAGQAYSLLNRLRRNTRLEGEKAQTDITFDVAKERQEEMKKLEDRADKGFLGRMYGGGGGGLLGSLLLTALLTPVLGPLAGPVAAGIGGGVGSYAGQKLTTGKISPGKWDVSEDERREKDYKTGMYGSAFQDALTSGMLSYLGGKFLTPKPGPGIVPSEGLGGKFMLGGQSKVPIKPFSTNPNIMKKPWDDLIKNYLQNNWGKI